MAAIDVAKNKNNVKRIRAADLAPKYHPVLSPLQRFLTCSPILRQRELEFSGILAQVGVCADERSGIQPETCH